MKRFIFFARVFSWLLIFFPFAGQSQELAIYPNYVVIGAFEHKKNAVFFTDDANHHNFPARFEMNRNRNLYYVYVLTTDDREYAFAEALKLRTDTKYFDTWVYSGSFEKDASKTPIRQDGDFNPTTGERIESVSSKPGEQGDLRSDKGFTTGDGLRNENLANSKREKGTAQDGGTAGSTNTTWQNRSAQNETTSGGTVNEGGAKNQVTIRRADGSAVVTRTDRAPSDDQRVSVRTAGEARNQTANTSGKEVDNYDASADPSTLTGPGLKQEGLAAAKEREVAGEPGNKATGNTTVLGPPPKQATTEPLAPEEVVGKNFYFYLYRADNHDMVAGEVDAIDFEKSRRMATYEANTQVKIIMPSGKTKQISFLCQVFGYRKLQKEFDPANPADDMYLDDKGNVVVPFELMRLQKGDIAIMYNVFFFKDAAVMRPESRYEVNNLLELLQENPSYKIKIHGHTNGNAPGKIIYMDKPGNFYSLSNTRQGGGSAKKLSEERALVIREYLISSGISADRMKVEAWGGKKPIHDKHSARAHENVRVEIEILSE